MRVPLLNFEEGPGVPLLNFEGGIGVSLLNFRRILGPILNFEGGAGPKSQGPGVLGSWSHFYTCLPKKIQKRNKVGT